MISFLPNPPHQHKLSNSHLKCYINIYRLNSSTTQYINATNYNKAITPPQQQESYLKKFGQTHIVVGLVIFIIIIQYRLLSDKSLNKKQRTKFAVNTY